MEKQMSDYEPSNTKDKLYLWFGSYGDPMDFEFLIENIKNHFGVNISLSELDINSEYIHTRHIGYDLYDPSDYACYIIITRK
jgi:hypothetical protein